jgi:hypothetical protein
MIAVRFKILHPYIVAAFVANKVHLVPVFIGINDLLAL